MMLIENSFDLAEKVNSLRLQFSTRIVIVYFLNNINEDDEITITYKNLSIVTNLHLRTAARACKQLESLEYVKATSNTRKGQEGKGKLPNTFKVSLQRLKLAIIDRQKEIDKELIKK
jgi:hypothetical protein